MPNMLPSEVNESPTRRSCTVQSGQVPMPPRPLLPWRELSLDSPSPWPYCVSSWGSLSSWKKSQPEMSSTYPLASPSLPSVKAAIRSWGSRIALPLTSPRALMRVSHTAVNSGSSSGFTCFVSM